FPAHTGPIPKTILSPRQTAINRQDALNTCPKGCRTDVSVSLYRHDELSPRSQLTLRCNTRLARQGPFQRLAFAAVFWQLFCFPSMTGRQCGCKAAARAVPHYGLPRLVCGTDAIRAARPIGIYDRTHGAIIGGICHPALTVFALLTNNQKFNKGGYEVSAPTHVTHPH